MKRLPSLVREQFLKRVTFSFSLFPVVALVGPRQSGKTTLARTYAQGQKGFGDATNYFDLEDEISLARLRDPQLGLQDLKGLVVIDEVQRLPHVFQTLRVLVDRPHREARFLILGSAGRDLLSQSSETLAGRICFIEITPFHLSEVFSQRSPQKSVLEKLWLRGGFPQSFLSETEEGSVLWRKEYIRTYLERDVPNLGIHIPPAHLRRFWMMLIHYHGQIFNGMEMARSLDMSDQTAKRYLDLLCQTFLVRVLRPWHENIGKRQVKRPKIYMRDSGLFHHLLGVSQKSELDVHPKMGASWEGFALEQVLSHLGVEQEEAYFWGVHAQGELDLLVVKNGKKLGFEFKHTLRPTITSSLRLSEKHLKPDELCIVYPGEVAFNLSPSIKVRPLLSFAE